MVKLQPILSIVNINHSLQLDSGSALNNVHAVAVYDY